MKTKMIIMKANGTSEEREIDLPEDPGYDVLASLIRPLLDGADLEHVSVLHDGPKDMFVDDDGLAKELPRNEAATRVYRNNWLTQHPEDAPETLPEIVGPAVLFPDRRVWF